MGRVFDYEEMVGRVGAFGENRDEMTVKRVTWENDELLA
jgi:hypothetical protein